MENENDRRAKICSFGTGFVPDIMIDPAFLKMYELPRWV